MVCREYNLSSVLIAQVRTASWLDDAQIQSLFHGLRHDPRINQTIPTQEGYWDRQSVFERVVEAARHDIDTNPMWRSARRIGLRNRLEGELDRARDHMPYDTLSALDRLQRATVESQRQLRARLQQMGAQLGMSEREVTQEFHRLRSEAPSGRQARATDAERADLGMIPADPRTRFALAQLREMPPRRTPSREVDQWMPVDPDPSETNPVVEVGISQVSDRIETRRSDGSVTAWKGGEAQSAALLEAMGRGSVDPRVVRQVCTQVDTNPYGGFRSRCDRCGQFVGSRPHSCVDGRQRMEMALRRVRVDGAEVTCPDPETMLEAFGIGDPPPRLLQVPAHVSFAGHDVTGDVTVRRGEEAINSDRGRHMNTLDLDDAGLSDSLTCSHCHTTDCEHVGVARTMLRRRLERAGRRPIGQVQERARAAVLAAITEAEPAAEPAVEVPRVQLGPTTVAWSDDPEAFRRHAQAGKHEGVLFQERDNALTGYAAGVRFGVELEFIGDRDAVGWELTDFGLLPNPDARRYHASQNEGWHNWSLEEDCSVDGELITPIMNDTATAWGQLQQACDTLRSHGGTDTAGSHVNISCDSYTPQDAWRLAHLFRAHEADLFRMGRTRNSVRDIADYSYPLRDPGMAQWTHYSEAFSSGGHAMINLCNAFLPVGRARLEYRFPDASHDPGVIQAQVKLCAALTNFCRGGEVPVGEHQSWGAVQSEFRGRSVLGMDEAGFAEQTQGIRSLIDRLATTDEDRVQLAQLWGRGSYVHE